MNTDGHEFFALEDKQRAMRLDGHAASILVTYTHRE